MRWFYSLAIATAIMLGGQTVASASPPPKPAVVVKSTTTHTHSHSCKNCRKVRVRKECCIKKFFRKLWELEKKKNAWLIKTFLH